MKMNRINTKRRMAVLCGGTCVSPVVSSFTTKDGHVAGGTCVSPVLSSFTTYAKQKQRTFLKTFDGEFSGKLERC